MDLPLLADSYKILQKYNKDQFADVVNELTRQQSKLSVRSVKEPNDEADENIDKFEYHPRP